MTGSWERFEEPLEQGYSDEMSTFFMALSAVYNTDIPNDSPIPAMWPGRWEKVYNILVRGSAKPKQTELQ
jgi:hypothetical protein